MTIVESQLFPNENYNKFLFPINVVSSGRLKHVKIFAQNHLSWKYEMDEETWREQLHASTSRECSVLHNEISDDPNILSRRTRARTVEDKGGVAAEDALGQRLRARRPADLRQRPLQEEEVLGVY